MTDRTTIKAARLAALYELRDMLPGVSQQQLADLFKLGHRSTAGRDLAGLDELARLVPELKADLLRLAVALLTQAQAEHTKSGQPVHYWPGPQSSVTLCGRYLRNYGTRKPGPIFTADKLAVTCGNCKRSLQAKYPVTFGGVDRDTESKT